MLNIKQRIQLARALPGGELEQGLLRIVLSSTVLAYLLYLTANGFVEHKDIHTYIIVAWYAYCIGTVAHVMYAPRVHHPRRALNVALDIAGTGFACVVCGPYGGKMLAIYAWNMTGYAFRYGTRYLIYAQILAVASVTYIMYSEPMWPYKSHEIYVMLLFLLIVVPYYTYRFTRREARILSENRELLHRTMNVEEVERRNLAQELHDMIGQDVVGMRQQCHLASRALSNASLNEKAAQAVKINTQLVEDVDQKIRNIMHRLMPETIETLGLIGAIKERITRLQETFPGTIIHSTYPDHTVSLSDDDEIAVFRIVIEGVTNALRHADAKTIEIAIANKSNRQLEIHVYDDGGGFNTDQTQEGFGIRGTRERVRSLGGQMTLQSSRGGGTRLMITIPLSQKL